jgi:hypothetical protein
MSPAAVGLTVVCMLLVVLLPGLLVGAAAGLRGWLLAGTAPLLSYAVGGLAGPWLHGLGLPFNGWTFAAATGVFVAAGLGLRWLTRRRTPSLRPVQRRRPAPQTTGRLEAPLWPGVLQAAVVGCTLLGAAVGVYTVLHGIGRLDAIPQDWDAAFHANGIRYAADTGDGGLYGMSGVNKYGGGTALFYPNAYHLLATVAYQLTGSPIPAILNANTVLLPGLLALSLVTLVREFRGRAVLACCVALLAVAPATLLYASMARGPLLPFLLGLTLLPLGAVVLHRFLHDKRLSTGLLLALCAAGLLVIHPSTLLAGVLFALPMLGQRWLARGARRIGGDLLGLATVGVAAALLAAPQLLGAVGRPSDAGPMQWPVTHDVQSAVGALVVFQHAEPHPQLWLAAALVLGVAFSPRLGGLRWVAATAALTSTMWVVVATTDDPTVVDLSQPWWNDPWRFVAMAALPLTVLAAHGLAETQAWLRDRMHATRRREHATRERLVLGGAAAVVLVLFTGGTKLLYSGYNAGVVSTGYGAERVNADEARAMLELARLARPADWAMNDRFDGTVWTYAVSGVRTIAAHYDEVRLSDEAYLLGDGFRRYRTDPAVQDAVERLNVQWVIVGKHGFIRDKQRSPGLEGYDDLPFLTKVYDNPGAAVYRLMPARAATSASSQRPPSPR